MDLETDITKLKGTISSLEISLQSQTQQKESHQSHNNIVTNQIDDLKKSMHQTEIKLNEKISEAQKWKQAASEAQQDQMYDVVTL